MKDWRTPRQTAAPIQSSIEGICGALVTLESLYARAGDGTAEDLRRSIRQAIESLRQAISDLRAVSVDGARLLPGEFVLRAGARGIRVPPAN